jgi:hypothetical protein
VQIQHGLVWQLVRRRTRRLSGTFVSPPPLQALTYTGVACLTPAPTHVCAMQDCCNGTGCPACVTDISNECNAGANETWKACHPTKECLKRMCPHWRALSLSLCACSLSLSLCLAHTLTRCCQHTECPAVDEMDLACAGHDSCCIRNRLPTSLPSCYPEGNYCWCDCNLVSNVRHSFLSLSLSRSLHASLLVIKS